MANDENHAPGSFVLIWIFFATMVLLYFLNWKYLSAIWHVGTGN